MLYPLRNAILNLKWYDPSSNPPEFVCWNSSDGDNVAPLRLRSRVRLNNTVSKAVDKRNLPRIRSGELPRRRPTVWINQKCLDNCKRNDQPNVFWDQLIVSPSGHVVNYLIRSKLQILANLVRWYNMRVGPLARTRSIANSYNTSLCV